MIIYFSSQIAEYGWMSNFYLTKFIWNNQEWKSSEHAYQAMKSTNPLIQQAIAEAPSAGAAKKAGRTISSIRPDWNDVKIGLMEEIVKAKFEQNSLLIKLLLNTEEKTLIEYAPWGDTFWGVNKDLKGENHLGKILMELRTELREKSV
jgi:ribA/ribD-fused uncharacterized protein